MHLQKVLALHTHSMSPEEYELQPDVPSLMLGWRVGNSSDLRKEGKPTKKKNQLTEQIHHCLTFWEL